MSTDPRHAKKKYYIVSIDDVFSSTNVGSHLEWRTYEKPSSDPGLAARGYKQKIKALEEVKVYTHRTVGHVNVKATCMKCAKEWEYGYWDTFGSNKVAQAARILPKAERCPSCKYLNHWAGGEEVRVDGEVITRLGIRAIGLATVMVFLLSLVNGLFSGSLTGYFLAAIQFNCLVPWLIALAGFLIHTKKSKTLVLMPLQSQIFPSVIVTVIAIGVSQIFGTSIGQHMYFGLIPTLLGSLFIVFVFST